MLGESVTMHAASTMKTPVLLEVMRRVDAGTLRLSDQLDVKNEFKSLVDGSPFAIGLEPESDGPSMAKLGGKAQLDFLLKEMIVRSSNLATMSAAAATRSSAAIRRGVHRVGAPRGRLPRTVSTRPDTG